MIFGASDLIRVDKKRLSANFGEGMKPCNALPIFRNELYHSFLVKKGHLPPQPDSDGEIEKNRSTVPKLSPRSPIANSDLYQVSLFRAESILAKRKPRAIEGTKVYRVLRNLLKFIL
jgi:hypothetical protein